MEGQEEVHDRVSRLVPSDLAADVVAAVESLDGEAQRFEIIDRALEIRGWTDEELGVVSWYAGAARTYHLRTLADYAVTLCYQRGQLVEAGRRGRWRLADVLGGSIQPHAHDRVFIAAVGVAGEPVGDDWDAGNQARLWFSTISRQLSTGDHVFVLGAGRGSAVFGLFESLSAGTTRDVPHPANPKRWPWSIQARPLASVPPLEAGRVNSLVAPRGAPQWVRDANARRALYGAVDGYEVPHPVNLTNPRVIDDGGVAGRVGARCPRAFDPGSAPSATGRTGEILRSEESGALQEKARQGHHDILVGLQAALESDGWSEIEEIPAAIDLRGRDSSGRTVIFEAKTLRDNEISQTRSALAQLLEYRLDYGQPDNDICLVVDRVLGEHRVALLTRLGVGVLVVAGGTVQSLNRLAPVLE